MKYFAIAGLLLMFSACDKKPVEIQKSLNERLKFSFSQYTTIFENQLTSIDGYILRQDSTIRYYDTLK
ncbi:MAG: hypothetical protein OEM46_09675, partial [Ignavibacteria bacterium]|nr:hypothetical protein [Ignavibacteria bacterium]